MAVAEIKRGLQLDSQWPWHGAGLREIYGAANVVLKDSILLKVAAWVREDVRDPDRLFLMGVLLHFNEDRERALPFFRTVDTLAGRPAYVQPFLRAPEPQEMGARQPGVRQVGGVLEPGGGQRVAGDDVYGNVPAAGAKPAPLSQPVAIFPRTPTPFRRPAETTPVPAAQTPVNAPKPRDVEPRPAEVKDSKTILPSTSAPVVPNKVVQPTAPKPAPVSPSPAVEGPQLLLPGEVVPK